MRALLFAPILPFASLLISLFGVFHVSLVSTCGATFARASAPVAPVGAPAADALGDVADDVKTVDVLDPPHIPASRPLPDSPGSPRALESLPGAATASSPKAGSQAPTSPSSSSSSPSSTAPTTPTPPSAPTTPKPTAAPAPTRPLPPSPTKYIAPTPNPVYSYEYEYEYEYERNPLQCHRNLVTKACYTGGPSTPPPPNATRLALARAVWIESAIEYESGEYESGHDYWFTASKGDTLVIVFQSHSPDSSNLLSPVWTFQVNETGVYAGHLSESSYMTLFTFAYLQARCHGARVVPEQASVPLPLKPVGVFTDVACSAVVAPASAAVSRTHAKYLDVIQLFPASMLQEYETLPENLASALVTSLGKTVQPLASEWPYANGQPNGGKALFWAGAAMFRVNATASVSATMLLLVVPMAYKKPLPPIAHHATVRATLTGTQTSTSTFGAPSTCTLRVPGDDCRFTFAFPKQMAGRLALVAASFPKTAQLNCDYYPANGLYSYDEDNFYAELDIFQGPDERAASINFFTTALDEGSAYYTKGHPRYRMQIAASFVSVVALPDTGSLTVRLRDAKNLAAGTVTLLSSKAHQSVSAMMRVASANASEATVYSASGAFPNAYSLDAREFSFEVPAGSAGVVSVSAFAYADDADDPRAQVSLFVRCLGFTKWLGAGDYSFGTFLGKRWYEVQELASSSVVSGPSTCYAIVVLNGSRRTAVAGAGGKGGKKAMTSKGGVESLEISIASRRFSGHATKPKGKPPAAATPQVRFSLNVTVTWL